MSNIVKANNCIFCKIIDKVIPATIISEDDKYMAIKDINPQAPCHILIMPKKHVDNLMEFEDSLELGKLFQYATKIAKQMGLNSFRLVVNTGLEAGQTVFHLHVHVLGGRNLNWPPG